MRERCSEPYRFTLWEHGALMVLEAECNVSAAYFTVTFVLLPHEAEAMRAASDGGRALAGELADEAQRSVEKLRAARADAWAKLGQVEPPAPKLR